MLLLTVDQKKKLAELGEREFIRVDDALDYIRAHRPEDPVVFIKKGEYYEKLFVDVPGVTLIGEEREGTILTYNDNSGKEGLGTAGCQSIKVEPEATDFAACNLTIRNHYNIWRGMREKVVGTQSVALQLTADRCVLYHCDLRSLHDTLLAQTGRHYFKNCFIMGDVDFIFGRAQSVFEGCEIFSSDARHRHDIWGGKGYICAPDTPLEFDYGYLFANCRMTSDVQVPHSVHLGRSRGPHAAAAFIGCELGGHISVEGFTWMGKEERRYYPMNARFAEYGSTGPGAVQYRSPYRNLLTEEEAAPYTKENVWGCHSGSYDAPYDGEAALRRLQGFAAELLGERG